jgi:hypothetical protein
MALRAGDRAPRYWGRLYLPATTARWSRHICTMLGRHCFVRAQAAQAAPNIRLESLHVALSAQRQNRIERPACSASSMPLLWPSSAIGVWLLLDFGRQFNKSPDCFSTRWEVGLAAAPVVYRPQKLLRYPHLKQAILRAFRWAATGPVAASHFYNFCLDINTSKVYARCRPMASSELATGPNPSHGGKPWPRLSALLRQSAS